MKTNKLIKSFATIICASTLLGCATGELTPVPKSTSAVLVGIGYKCDKKELQKKGSDLDVASVYETIRYCYSGATADVYDEGDGYVNYHEHIFDPKIGIGVYQDELATCKNVKNAMANAVNSELAIIYFSCKATQIDATDETEEDGKDECLMLYDGLLTDNEIWEILQTAKGRVFIVFDTGHSATMFRATKDGVEKSENMLIDLADDIEHQLIPEKNENLSLLCWSACLDSENIDERSIGSRMTNAFYFKSDKWYTYKETFDRMVKSVGDKQKLNKTVIGTNYEDKSMFR